MAVTINGSGKLVVNINQSEKTDTASNSTAQGATWQIPLTCVITPISASNRILVIASISMSMSETNNWFQCILTRGGSAIAGATGDAAGDRKRVSFSNAFDATYQCVTNNFTYLDHPNSTSEQTYGVQVGHSAGASKDLYLNIPSNDYSQNYGGRSASFIQLLEVTGW